MTLVRWSVFACAAVLILTPFQRTYAFGVIVSQNNGEQNNGETGSTILIRFNQIGKLTESNLTEEERRKVVEAVKEKFESTNVTIVDNVEAYNKAIKEARGNSDKTVHQIYVNSLPRRAAGHARHCGENGKVYDSSYIDGHRNPKDDRLREDPDDPNSPLDSDKVAIGIANTVAHEIGHLLGLDDDTDRKSPPHLMKSPITRTEDLNPLSFTDADKQTIKGGKTKASAPDAEEKERQLSFVRGSEEPLLAEGLIERTDWVPFRFETSPGFSAGYINTTGDFYALSDLSPRSDVFNFAPSLPFDLALLRFTDDSVFTLSTDALNVMFEGELSGLEARFPFDGVYYDRADIFFDTTGNGLSDTILSLQSAVVGTHNGLTLDRVPYAPALEAIPEPSSFALWGVLTATGILRCVRMARKKRKRSVPG